VSYLANCFYVSYADDSYVVCSGDDLQTKIEKLKKKRDRMFKRYKKELKEGSKNTTWLKRSKMYSKMLRKMLKIEINNATKTKATSSNSKTFW